jgi:hypothetical protein
MDNIVINESIVQNENILTKGDASNQNNKNFVNLELTVCIIVI